jgi:hypothetical protein
VHALVGSSAWMLRAARIEPDGIDGRVRTAGLSAVYASAFRTWLDDDDPGLARTMAALDRRLRRGERTLRGILFIMFILQIIATAQVFLEPFLFTGGGPAGATKTILLYIYDKAFRNSLGGDYGEATAVSVLLAIVLAILSWLYFKLTDRWSTS